MKMSNKNTSVLATRFKKARKELGYSQKQMGEALRLSDKAVSAYEVGRATPSLETLKQMGKLTQRPMSYFLDESNQDDVDLQIKIKNIERELLEVKKLLQKK